jgi:hypothetical protein
VITKLDIIFSYFYQDDICSGTVAFEPCWIGILDLAVDNDMALTNQILLGFLFA